MELTSPQLLSMAGAVLAWVLTVERRIYKRMTLKEHKDICEKQNKVVNEKLDALRRTLTASNYETNRHRDRVNKKLNRVNSDLRVIRTKMGQDVFRDGIDGAEAEI